MSRSVDSRIVEMKFENGKFKNDIKDTIDSLEKLKKETDFKEVQKSAKEFDLSKVKKEVNSLNITFKEVLKLDIFKRLADGIVDTFSNSFRVIPNLWNKALNQIKTGGWSRATNIDQATFQLKGLGIEIERIDKQINAAVEGTAYGYDQAAKAASQLAASQVKIGAGFKDITFKGGDILKKDVDEMERALGAISGIAAMTNSQFDDIADIFTDAAGRGKVSADTFNRIAQRGLNSAAALAEYMHISEASVKDLASKGKISFQEFSDAMYSAFYQHAKDANETFEGSLSNMKAALSRVGQPFAKSIRAMMIGPFNELKETIKKVKSSLEDTGLYDYFDKLTRVIDKVFSTLIKNFRENDKNFEWVGNLTQAFKNLVDVIVNIVIPIKDAFKSVFGDSIITSVNELTKSFAKFTEKLKPTGETMSYIRMAFEGFFQILKSIGRVIGQVISGITGLNVEGTSLLGWIGKAIAISLKVIGILAEFAVDCINIKGLLEGVTRALNFFIKSIGAVVLAIGGGLALAFTSAYKIVNDFVELITTKVGSPSSNPVIILVREIVARVKEIPSIFPNAITKIKEFFKAFNTADTINAKFKVLFTTITSFRNKIGEVLKNISDSIRTLGDDNLLTKFIASVVYGIGSIIQNVGDFAIIVNSVIIAGLGKAADSIKNFFSVFADNIRKFDGNILLAFWKTFTEGLKNFLSNIPSAVGGLKQFFAELNVLDRIKEKFAGFVDFIAKAINFLKDSFSTLGVVTVYAAELDESVDNVTGASNKSKWDTSGIQNFINKFKEFVKNIDLGKLAVIGFIGVITSIILQFRNFIKSITEATKSVTGVFNGIKKLGEKIGDSFTGMFGKVGESIKGYFDTLAEGAKHKTTFNEVANALLKFSGAIAILTGSLIILSKFMEGNEQSIIKAGGVLAALGIGIITFVGVLALMQKEADLGFLIKFSAVMIVMSIAMGILVKAMNNIDINGVEQRFITLGLLMGELALVTALLSKYAPELVKGSLSILTFSLTLSMLAKALDKVPEIVNMSGEILILGTLLGAGAVILGKASSIFAESLKSFGIAMASIATAALVISLTVLLLNNIGDISAGLLNLTEILGVLLGFSIVITQINKKLGQGELPKFNASMILLAGSVGLLAITAKMLSKLNPADCLVGVLAVGALMTFIAGLMRASEFTEKAHPVKFAAGLLLISGCVAIMAGISALIGLINLTQLLKGVGVIAALEALVGGLMYVSQFTEKADYKSIMAALIGVNAIIVELLLLSMIKDFTPIFKSLAVIAGVLLAFGAMMAGVGKAHYSKNTPLSLLAMIAIVTEIIGALYLLSNYCEWGPLIAAGVSISAVFLAFGKTMKTISSLTGLKPEKIKNFLAASLALIPIAGALWAVSQGGDWGAILASGTSISMVMLTFGKVFQSISSSKKIDTAQIAKFLAASLSLLPIAKAISDIAVFDWNNLLAAGVALSATLLAVAGALRILSGNGIKDLASGGAILLVAASLQALAQAFLVMQDVQWETLGKAGAVLAGVSVALGLLSFVAAGALVAAGAIGIVAVALDLISLAMIGAAYAMQMFTPCLQILAGLPLAEIGAGLVPLAGGLSLLGAAGIALALGGVGLLAASMYMPGLAIGLLALSKVGDISHIPGPLALIGAASLVLGAATPGMLLAGAAFTVLSAGITLLGTAVSRASVLISAGINLIVSTLQMGAVSIKNSGEQIGTNVGAGMLNGIKSSLPNVLKGASAMGKGIIDTVKTVLDVHSPSRIMQWIGKMCGVGFTEGSTDASVWADCKAKITARINDSILAPAVNAIGKLKSAFSGLSTTIQNGTWKDKLPTSIKNIGDKIKTTAYETTGLDKVFKDLNLDALTTGKGLDGMAGSANGLTDALTGGGSGGGAKGAVKETKDAFAELKDTITNQMDIFSEFQKKTELTSDKLLENMRSQIKGVQDWSYMMGELAIRGIDQGLLQKLADMGPQGYEYVNAFVQMTNDQLSEANKLYAQSLVLPSSSASFVMNSFAVAGQWATQGFENGLDMEKFRKSGVEGANAVRDGLEGAQGLQIHSPSRVMYENGRFAIAGFVKGVDNQAKISLEPKMISVAQSVIKIVKSELDSNKFMPIGANVIQGLINGMASKEGELKNKADSIANSITNKISSALKIHSPSRVMMALGKFVPEGLAIGIESKRKLVDEASDNLANTAITGLKNAIKAVSDLDNMGMDFNPVITPVLDLSEIESGSAEINKLSSKWDNVSIGVSSDLAANASTGFNRVTAAKANLALENQNGISMLKSAISALGSNESNMTQNNTFNISGDDPRAIADEVSRVLQMQVERRGAVWA